MSSCCSTSSLSAFPALDGCSRFKLSLLLHYQQTGEVLSSSLSLEIESSSSIPTLCFPDGFPKNNETRMVLLSVALRDELNMSNVESWDGWLRQFMLPSVQALGISVLSPPHPSASKPSTEGILPFYCWRFQCMSGTTFLKTRSPQISWPSSRMITWFPGSGELRQGAKPPNNWSSVVRGIETLAHFLFSCSLLVRDQRRDHASPCTRMEIRIQGHWE